MKADIPKITVDRDTRLDRRMSAGQRAYVLGTAELRLRDMLDRARLREGRVLVIEVSMPAELGTVPCGLCGPCAGGEPIAEEQVVYVARRGRPFKSRMVDQPPSETNLVTVIIGPHATRRFCLYAMHAGPAIPPEASDPRLRGHETTEALDFWSEHAFSLYG